MNDQDEHQRLIEEMHKKIKDAQDLIKQQHQGGAPYGWVCPVCGRGLAPHVSQCPCMIPPMTVTC